MNVWEELLDWIDKNSESGITMFTPFGSRVPDRKISVPILKEKIKLIQKKYKLLIKRNKNGK